VQSGIESEEKKCFVSDTYENEKAKVVLDATKRRSSRSRGPIQNQVTFQKTFLSFLRSEAQVRDHV
jgi:hypothetical protein